MIQFIAAISGDLIDERLTHEADWAESLVAFMVTILAEKDARAVIESLRKQAIANIPGATNFEEEDDEGEDRSV